MAKAGDKRVGPDFQSDSILKKWIQPRYLDPETIRTIRESSLAKPYMKYAVLDDFFNTDILSEYVEHHKRLDFQSDDYGRAYDSSVVFAEKDKQFGSELFYHIPWHQLAAKYVGTELRDTSGKTIIKLRRHDPYAKGFWIHTDTAQTNPSSMVMLMFLNRGWTAQDGSLHQLWIHLDEGQEIEDVEYPLETHKDKRLDFLDERYSLTTELAGTTLLPGKALLIDQIIPSYNRVVFCDFVQDPAYHSVTPSNEKTRYAVVQWLY